MTLSRQAFGREFAPDFAVGAISAIAGSYVERGEAVASAARLMDSVGTVMICAAHDSALATARSVAFDARLTQL